MPTDRTELEARVRDLEAALKHARDLAEQERRRANRAEEMARVAFRVAAKP